MKKIIAILFLILLFTSGKMMPHHKKCIKCIEERETNKTCMTEIGIAWRDYKTPNIHKDGKVYALYRCCYGHSFLVDLSE